MEDCREFSNLDDIDDFCDGGTELSFAKLRFARDSSTLLIDSSGWGFRRSSLMGLTYEDALAIRLVKSLRIGGRQAQIKATVGSVVLQMMNLRAIPCPKHPVLAPC